MQCGFLALEKFRKCGYVAVLPWGYQGAKKVASDSPGLVDFSIRLVDSVLNLTDGQVKFF